MLLTRKRTVRSRQHCGHGDGWRPCKIADVIFVEFGGFRRHTRAMVRFVLVIAFLIAGCRDGSPDVDAANCAEPRLGFHSVRDPDFTTRWPVSIGGYQRNVIKITKAGALTWNDIDMATMESDGLPLVDDLLVRIKSFPARQPFTVLNFDAGAPCDKVEAVRGLMVKHLGCAEQDLCFQGDWDDL